MSRKKTSLQNSESVEPVISKSQLKREMDALQALGLEVVKLTDAQLQQVPLDPELLEAINLARRIRKKHEAFRRQMQFIGKLMRQRDTQAIEAALQQIKFPHQQETLAFHQVEHWRDELLKQGESSLKQLLEQHPQVDADKVREWLQQHHYQQQHGKPPMASRQLFVYLRKLLCEQPQ